MLLLLCHPLFPCLFPHLFSQASGKLKKQVYLRKLSKEWRNCQSCFPESSVLVCYAKWLRRAEKEVSSGHQNFTSALHEHSKQLKRLDLLIIQEGGAMGGYISYSKHFLEPPDRKISPLIYSVERKDNMMLS